MKFKIEKEKFKNALAKMMFAIPQKPALPILANIYIVADRESGKLSLQSNNLECEITQTLSAEITEYGEGTIPAQKLVEITNRLKGETLAISINEDNFLTTIECGNSTIELPGMNPGDYPKSNTEKYTKKVEVKTAGLHQMIQRVAYAVDYAKTKSIAMQGILLTTEQQSNLVCLTATDGKRIAIAKSDTLSFEGDDIDVIIPIKIAMAAKILDEENTVIGINQEEGMFYHSIVIFNDTLSIKSKLIDAKYPDIQRIIPRDNTQEIPLQTKDLLTSLELLNSTIDKARPAVMLNFSDGKINLESRSSAGKVKDILDIDFNDNLEIRINPQFLIEPLKNCDDDKLTLLYKQQNHPLTIQNKDKTFQYVVMPLTA